MKVENKKIVVVLSTIVLIILISFLIINNRTTVEGKVAYANVGCCDLICQETSKNDCPNQFNPGIECGELPQCNVGCCIDYEGYCYDNYLQSNCQDNGEFKAISCTNVPKCVSELSTTSFIKSTGLPILYKEDQFLYSEPIVGKINTPFIIKAILFESENITSVEINVTAPNYTKKVMLFNDGAHGDGNANDSLFAGKWEYEMLEEIELSTIKQFEYNLNDKKNYILLTPTDCIPIIKSPKIEYESNKSKNIFFINPSDNNNMDSFGSKVNSIYNMLFNIQAGQLSEEYDMKILNSLNPYNYYLINKKIQFHIDLPTQEKVLKETKKECTFLNKNINGIKKVTNNNVTINYFVILDKKFPYCKQKDNLIIINSEFVFDSENITDNLTQNSLLENFCGHIITAKGLQDKMMAKQVPPMIEITHFSDNGQDVPNINLSFIIHDNKNETINYTIYADLDHPIMHLYKDTTINGKEINLTLNISDGKHIVQIKAEDSDNNLVISKALQIEKRVNDFVIQITSLDKIAHPTSPNITFKIIHKNDDQNIEYMVHDENLTLASGSVIPLVTKTISTNLTMGPHTIYITAEDNQKNIVTSWPYYIEVGNNKEPKMYAAGVEWYEG